jgi:hypothetical protein
METTSKNGQILIEGLVALLFFLGLFMTIHLLIQGENSRLTKNQKYNGYHRGEKYENINSTHQK